MNIILETPVTYITSLGETEKKTLQELLQQTAYTVLYFYPKDNTPGCTVEAKEFSELINNFKDADAQVIGISKDTGPSHCRFQEKQELNIGLISDTKKILQAMFKAEGKKKFMGKEYLGTLRNTYLLDNQGTVLYKWEEVKPLGHAQDVLEHIHNLKK